MPRLPDPYNVRPVPSGVRPLARVRNAGAIGAAVADLGGNVQKLGADLDAVLARQRQEEAAAAAADGEVAASSRIRQRLYDPEGGFLNTTGAAAVQGRKAVHKDLDTLPDEILKGMNPEAAKRLKPVLASKIETARRQVDTHTSSERTAWLNSASEARVANATVDAVTRYASTEEVEKSLRIGVGELQNRREREGWSAEQFEAEREAFVSRTLKEVILRRAQHDPVAAMEYARANADRLGPEMAHVEQAVGRAAKESEGRAIADQALAGEADPLGAVMSIPDPQVRDAALRHVERRQQIEAGQQAQARRQAQQQMFTSVEAGTDPRTLPLELRAAAGREAVRAMENYYDQKSSGFAVRTDPELFSELVKEAQADPSAFTQRELLAYRDRLSESDYRSMVEEQAKIADGGQADVPDFDHAHRVWRSVGIENGQPGSELSKRFAGLEVEFTREWSRFVEREKRQPTLAEQSEIAGRVAIDSSLFGSAQRLARETTLAASASELRSAAEPLLRAAEFDPQTVAEFHSAHQREAQRFVERTGRQPTSVEAAQMAERMLTPFNIDYGIPKSAEEGIDKDFFGRTILLPALSAVQGLIPGVDRFAFKITLEDLEAVRTGLATLTHDGREITLPMILMAGRMLRQQGNADPTIPELLALVVGE